MPTAQAMAVVRDQVVIDFFAQFRAQAASNRSASGAEIFPEGSTAAATTGPASAPRPASSIPAMCADAEGAQFLFVPKSAAPIHRREITKALKKQEQLKISALFRITYSRTAVASLPLRLRR